MFMALATAASGQQTMTLKECMQHAVNNSIKMKTQKSETDDARIARRDAILRAFTPEVSAGTYAYSNFGRSVDPETNTYVSTTSFNNGYSVGAGITLFNGFEAVNNIRISKISLKMGTDREKLCRDELCLATMQAYYNVAYYKELVCLLESQVSTASRSLEVISRQEELGQKGYADVVGMEAEVAEREYQLIIARNQYSDALLTLKDLMFWPLNKELNIAGYENGENALLLTSKADTGYIVEHSKNVLPSIAVARANMENARIELKMAKWRFTPSISLNAGWSTSYYTYPGQTGYVPVAFGKQFTDNGGEYIQLSLNFPIFSRLSTFSNLRRKKNAYARATLQYEQKVREVEAEITRAVQDRDGASAAYFQAEKRAKVQEEAYRLNLRRLDQGLISAIDFQKASDNWLNAKTGQTDALLKFYIKRSVVDYYNGIDYLEQ